MQLEHEFNVPVPVALAWDVLTDVERVAPCMPGLTVESFDGETVVGRVKLKVGPIQVTYAGTARFTETDASVRRTVIEASGKEVRGSGTANATFIAQLHDGGSSTRVTVTTDLAITGRPAQFGRGVLVEVGDKLLGRFVDCLVGELGTGEVGAPAPVPAPSPKAARGPSSDGSAPPGQPAAGIAAATTGTSRPQARPASSPTPIRRADNDAIDLLDTAGLPVLKRLAPVFVGLVMLLVLWRLVARRR